MSAPDPTPPAAPAPAAARAILAAYAATDCAVLAVDRHTLAGAIRVVLGEPPAAPTPGRVAESPDSGHVAPDVSENGPNLDTSADHLSRPGEIDKAAPGARVTVNTNLVWQAGNLLESLTSGRLVVSPSGAIVANGVPWLSSREVREYGAAVHAAREEIEQLRHTLAAAQQARAAAEARAQAAEAEAARLRDLLARADWRAHNAETERDALRGLVDELTALRQQLDAARTAPEPPPA